MSVLAESWLPRWVLALHVSAVFCIPGLDSLILLCTCLDSKLINFYSRFYLILYLFSKNTLTSVLVFEPWEICLSYQSMCISLYIFCS